MSPITYDPQPTEIDNTEISGLLKRAYARFRVDTLPQNHPLLAQVEKQKPKMGRAKWGGEGVYGNAILSLPGGMTASGSGYLPRNTVRRERQFKLGIRRLYATRQIDGLTAVGTADLKHAYASIVKKALEEMRLSTRWGLQEILHGNGRGIKALVGAVTDTTHYTAISPYGIVGAGEGGLLLAEGVQYAIHSGTTTTVRGRTTFTTITNSGDTATIVGETAVTGVAAGDAIVACTDNDTALDQYPAGLMQILNRNGSYNSFEDIDAATEPRWDGVRLVAGTDTPTAARVDEADITRLFRRAAAKSGYDARENPDDFLLMTTPGLEQKMLETYVGQRTIPIDAMMDIKGGFKAVRICGVPLISDAFCPAGCVYLIHIPSLLWIDAKDWGYVTFEGAGPWRWIDGRDAYETSFGAYMEFGTDQRNAHAMISGYTDTERFTHVM